MSSNTENKPATISNEANLVIQTIGRPPKFETPEEMVQTAGKYIEACDLDNTIPTIAGMAFMLGMDRNLFFNYSKKDEFSSVIKGIREYLLLRMEKRLMNMNTPAAGVIFLAKNYGYTDKQELELTKPIEIVLQDYTGKGTIRDLNIEEAEVIEGPPDQPPAKQGILPPSTPDNKTEEKQNSENSE